MGCESQLALGGFFTGGGGVVRRQGFVGDEIF